VVSTLGSILNQTKGRNTFDLSELRVFVLDEADAFFTEQDRKEDIMKFDKLLKGLKKHVQYVFFSATYDPEVAE
jgi:superfamily II DNA/RNA helicase